MRRFLLVYISLVTLHIQLYAMGSPFYSQSAERKIATDSLPLVFSENGADLIDSKLRSEAILKYNEHQLPGNLKELESFRANLRNEIIQKANIYINHKLPLDIKETGTIKMKGYSIKKIAFQTRPGVYATANLYVPDGQGPFPAVIHMHGHWTDAKADEEFIQPVSHSLAANGYVCLTIDAFGAGERSTIHGKPEYHGSNLGASLMNIGESLMGFQISDNIRGVDLLCSLPYVDKNNIGATGASGGGNQTMWLTAMDDRIKAAVPVVSVGTFESYVMQSNCICELLIDGLTFTEEAGVLSLIAPRAVKMCNHNRDDIPTFVPSVMLKSYNRVKPVFDMLGVSNNIGYQLCDSTHGYWPADRETMLGWFDLHLKGKGNGEPRKEIPFETLPADRLMVYPKGERDPKVLSIEEYCKQKGRELRKAYLNATSFNVPEKREQLKSILRTNGKPIIKKVNRYTSLNGWDRLSLETTDDKLIPLLLLDPPNKKGKYFIISNPRGKSLIQTSLVNRLKGNGWGIVIADLSGTGEASSPNADTMLDDGMPFHTISRSELWLGKTVLGEWVKELNVVVQYLKSTYHAKEVGLDGTKETGLAGLFLSAIEGNVDTVVLRDAPVSYLFDTRKSVDFYSMAIHLPGFLNWGDVSLAAALSGKNISFINPLTMSGQLISKTRLEEYKTEFDKIRKICNQPGKTFFNQLDQSF